MSRTQRCDVKTWRARDGERQLRAGGAAQLLERVLHRQAFDRDAVVADDDVACQDARPRAPDRYSTVMGLDGEQPVGPPRRLSPVEANTPAAGQVNAFPFP